MEIVGHRGACGYAPENTLKSFSHALAMGCQRVEMDIHVSKDQVPVIIHDERVDRTTDGKGLVSDLTLAQLKALNAGDGERIPTLEEAIELCRGKAALQIELKAKNSPALVAAIIEKHWGTDNLVITSFDITLLSQFAALRPSVPLGLLNRDAKLDMISAAVGNKHRWVCPRFDIATRALVAAAHDKGLLVYVYHVNERGIASEFMDWGVDAIGTDFPDLLRNDSSTSAHGQR